MKIIIIVLVLLAIYTSSRASDGAQLIATHGVDAVAQLIVDTVNKDTPIKLDNYFTLERQQYLRSHKAIVTHYSVETRKLTTTETSTLKTNLYGKKVKKRCSTPSNRTLLDNGVKFEHLYSYTDGTYLMDYSVTIENCE